MANIAAFKGVRTRFRNNVSREVNAAKDVIPGDYQVSEITGVLSSASKFAKLIRCYYEQVETQMYKVTDAVGDTDSTFVESVIEEDCQLIQDAEQCLVELDQLTEDLRRREEMDEENVSKGVESENAQIIELQEKMQTLVGTQMELMARQEDKTMQKLLSEQIKDQRNFFEAQLRKEREVNCSVKLPKLELSSFGGDKLKWTSFWDAFECTVHKNKRLSNIEKFNYLLSKLYGEAKRAVAGLALPNENHGIALGILQERFGNRQVVTTHYKALINIAPPSTRVDSMRTFLDGINRHLRSLEVLKEDVDQHVLCRSIITSKLPEVVLRQLELNKGAMSKWTVSNLKDQISNYVLACEKAEKASKENKDRNMHSFQSSQEQFRKPVGSAETLFVKTKETPTNRFSVKCRYCSERHWRDECKKFKSVGDRKGRLKGACFKCLKDGHIMRDCKSKKLCVYCSQYDSHHRSLCPEKFGTLVMSGVHLSNESGGGSEHSPGQEKHTEESTDSALMSSSESVLMQTAKANVTNVCKSKSK